MGETSDSADVDADAEEVYSDVEFDVSAAYLSASESGIRFMIAVAWMMEARRMASYVQSL